MPIFKRYYIADIPGLGWLAQYYVTHVIHYVGAILLIAFTVYIATVYLKLMRKRLALTKSAYIRLSILAAVMATGIFRVLKNMPDIVFSPGFTMFIDISHLGFMMALMVCGLLAAMIGCKWIKESPQKVLGRNP
jgi:glucan phosphoethanolaminetransferase (alkaline phosphatase superfamily)